MKTSLLPFLRCPSCGTALTLETTDPGPEITTGTLTCATGAHRHPIVGGVPRFVPPDNYAASFGLQWTHFSRSQLDSHTGVPITRDRFFASTRWWPQDLAGRRVLDLGCGSGRFAEVALATGAQVVAVDYSQAVDACYRNLGTHPRLDVVQGTVYELPFAPGSFDVVYCLGVLQHTPDPEAAFQALARQLAPGGRIAVDLYPVLWRNVIWPKYWLRPITSRIAPARLFGLVQRLVPLLLPVSRVLGRVPLLGRQLRFAVPVANYEGIYPLSEAQLREWAVLDTFDMWSPIHDHPQTAATIARWLSDAGLVECEVYRVGHLVGRGVQPGGAPPPRSG